MRATTALLCAALALLSVEAAAQGSSQGPPTSKELAVAPQSAPVAVAQSSPTAAQVSTDGPANICRELVAYLQPKSPAPGSQPVPQAPATPSPPPGAFDEAQKLAEANDLQGCQKSAQKLRRAGLPLPAGLLALAALRPELLEKTTQR